MSVNVNEDFVGLLAREVTAGPIGDRASSCYPQVPLTLGGNDREHQIGVVWLENDFIKAGICPSLGGRIIAIQDLRTGIEVIPMPERLDLAVGGDRGVQLEHGIEFLAGMDRQNALGSVDVRLIEAAAESGKAAVMLFEMDRAVSWHGVITLPPDRAVLILEQKIQNRHWYSQEARSGLKIAGVRSGDVSVIDREMSLGWICDGEFATIPRDGRLGGRRIHEWRVELVVSSGIGEFKCGDDHVSVGFDERTLGVQSHGSCEGYKIFLHVAGQTLESSINQKVGATTSTALVALPGDIDSIAIKSRSGEIVAQWPESETQRLPRSFDYPHSLLNQLVARMESAQTQTGALMMGLEGFSLEARAIAGIRTQSWDNAEAAMEKYLAYHAEDGLGWWLKASVNRERGLARSDDDPDLPNAHYLMPLEPLLKAEAFLNTPVAEGMEPNPLLKPIAENPAVAAEVVGMYHRCWLRQGMARLCDELLRHRENAMVRYYWADAYLVNPRLLASAAEHVQIAEKLDIEPPLPWTFHEVNLIHRLHERFPDARRLNLLVKLIDSAKSQGYLGGSLLS